MCSIFGVLLNGSAGKVELTSKMLHMMVQQGFQRGRDGFGAVGSAYGMDFGFRETDREFVNCRNEKYKRFSTLSNIEQMKIIVGNTRAEPTTEYVKDKKDTDQQPYTLNDWCIVHNGTIANDKELRDYHYPSYIDSAAIVERLARPKLASFPTVQDVKQRFQNVVQRLKGSFAILAYHRSLPHVMFYACNYRPIWYVNTRQGLFLGSEEQMLPYWQEQNSPTMITPYTYGMFSLTNGNIIHQEYKLHPEEPGTQQRSLVICSGGLDSVVSATVAQKQMGHDITLIHFTYGSRAEEPEIKSVRKVAEDLNCKLVLFPMAIYDKEDSPLLQHDAEVAGGEAGAEFAHEWVPARNLVMLALATAYAEAKGFDNIILGNNLEEAGAYPDNEPEFIRRFNAMLPFAVADGKRVRVLQPVGNLMKHEIVALGLAMGAPLAHTWSCYRAGDLHCGKCGPCFMRKTAFKINGAEEVIQYESEE